MSIIYDFALIARGVKPAPEAPVEGGHCPSCGFGKLEIAFPDTGCSCHVCAPCARCESAFLRCAECFEVAEG